MNQITIIGHATRDAATRVTRNDKEVTHFGVAVSRGKDRDTDFFEVACWERSWVDKAVTKGSLVFVQGSMRSSKAENGTIYWAVTADKILVLKRKDKETEPKNGRSGKGKSQPQKTIYDPRESYV